MRTLIGKIDICGVRTTAKNNRFYHFKFKFQIYLFKTLNAWH